MVPAVFAILERVSQERLPCSSACRTLSLRRGGQAGPVAHCQPLSHGASRATTYHSDHFVQHRAGLRGCAEVRCGRWSLRSPAAKTFGFRARYAIRPTNADALAPIISQSADEHTRRLSASLPPTTHTRNGRETFCCTRCAPIDLCCCEETGAVCLPARAAAGANAAAILGICRVYVGEHCTQRGALVLIPAQSRRSCTPRTMSGSRCPPTARRVCQAHSPHARLCRRPPRFLPGTH
jgi:hypothetical protein